MGKIRNGIKRVSLVLQRYNRIINLILSTIPEKKDFEAFGISSKIGKTASIANPQNVQIGQNVRVRYGLHIINAPNEHVSIGDFSVIAPNVTIVTNSHRSTVGKTQFELSASHENDKSGDVIIEEDVWIGTNATILAGVHLGRGCIVGAGAVVTKDVPPYTIVAGIPARPIAAVFTKEDILDHERLIYEEGKRKKSIELEKLFTSTLNGLPVYGVKAHGKD